MDEFKFSENKLDNTKLTDFKTCPRKFFYSHVLGWRTQTPNIHLVFGTAWHEAMEYLLLNGYGETQVLRAFEKFLGAFHEEIPPELGNLNKKKNPDKAFVALAKYVSYPPYRKDLETFETLYTEIAGKIMIDDVFSLYFRQDSILRNRETGNVRSREHKTGSSNWLWDEQWTLSGQVGVYSHVLNCLFPNDKVDGVEMNGVFFSAAKNPRTEDMFHRFMICKTKDQMQTWIDNTRFYLWEIQREYRLLNDSNENDQNLSAFPLRDTSCVNYGKVCEFHDFCLAWPNPLRYCSEPPIGFVKYFWDPTAREAKKTFEFHVDQLPEV